jgi:propionyl-CoA synthetase
MTTYKQFHARSISDPQGFWAEQAALVDWKQPFTQVLDYSRPPFAKWFVGGTTNLCHNAVDRHLAARSDQAALIYISTETGEDKTYTYAQLYREVNRMAGILQGLGVGRGDRVLIYMPMVPEAAFAMLACARIGAIHSVVFGGFASVSLATRIDDAQPKVIVSADAGSRAGKPVPYKHLLDEAISLARFPPSSVLIWFSFWAISRSMSGIRAPAVCTRASAWANSSRDTRPCRTRSITRRRDRSKDSRVAREISS